MDVKVRIRTKVMAAILAIVIVMAVTMGIVSVKTTQDKVLHAAQDKLQSDMKMAQTLIDQRYPGKWRLQEGKLYKGQQLMNDNFELVDLIGERTGDTVTIFQKDKRITTNVIKDGQRAIGTQATPIVIDTVLKEQKTYMGKADVVGVWNQTLYTPLKDENNQVIGMLYVGVPNTPYDQMVQEFALVLLGIALLMIFLGVMVAVYLAAHLNGPLQQLVKGMVLVGDGDLSMELSLNRQDEMGVLEKSYNKMLKNMHEVLATIRDGSEQVRYASQQMTATSQQVSAASSEIAENIEELASRGTRQKVTVVTGKEIINQVKGAIDHVSAGAQQQAAGIVGTKQTMGDMSKAIKEIANSTQEVAKAANETVEVARYGGQVVTRTITEMREIQDTVETSAVKIRHLGERTMEIDSIVQVIGDIADQTNLLALNANIEAARAGEHGKGFAVVADEVRKLAEKSSSSTQQIRQLVEGIQRETKEAVVSMEYGTDKVVAGVKLVEDTGSALNDIMKTVDITNNQIQGISASVEQMAANSNQLVQEIDTVSEVVQGNTAATEEMAASSEQIITNMNEIEREAIENVERTASISAATEELNATTQEIAAAAQNLQGMSEKLYGAMENFKL